MSQHGLSQSQQFRSLFNLGAAHFSSSALEILASAMIKPFDAPKDGPDDEENPFVPSGYTYLGQFIDHDLTFDTTSPLGAATDISKLSNLRTPRFDLDCVYGSGPDDQPYMFDGAKIILGIPDNSDDLSRINHRAVIGDPRNDENKIVAQIQRAFIRFHNKMVDAAPSGSDTEKFNFARQQTTWHYQYVILHDYLRRIVDASDAWVSDLFHSIDARTEPNLKLYDLSLGSYMPTEFSVAAYRFGHSMVRPGYRLNQTKDVVAIFDKDTGDDLRGFRELESENVINSWREFFDPTFAPGEEASEEKLADTTLTRTQFAYKIDPFLVNQLGTLPTSIAGKPPLSLAERNLKRGITFSLPSGEACANELANALAIKVQPIIRRVMKTDGTGQDDIKSLGQPEFKNSSPLWYYVLCEAEQKLIAGQSRGTQLRGLGGRIVVETFVGLLRADETSILRAAPNFLPITGNETFTMWNFLEVAGELRG